MGIFFILWCRKLVFIWGKMNAEYYVNILSNNLPDLARLMGLQNYIFQQDNGSKHTAKLYKAVFWVKII